VHTLIDPKQRNNDIDTTRFSFENRSTIVFTKQFEQISNLRGRLQSITLRIRSSYNHRKLPRHKSLIDSAKHLIFQTSTSNAKYLHLT